MVVRSGGVDFQEQNKKKPKSRNNETLCSNVMCCTSRAHNKQYTLFPQRSQEGKRREGKKLREKQRERANKGETRKKEKASQQRTKNKDCLQV
jgi:hypothetical protein